MQKLFLQILFPMEILRMMFFYQLKEANSWIYHFKISFRNFDLRSLKKKNQKVLKFLKKYHSFFPEKVLRVFFLMLTKNFRYFFLKIENTGIFLNKFSQKFFSSYFFPVEKYKKNFQRKIRKTFLIIEKIVFIEIEQKNSQDRRF